MLMGFFPISEAPRLCFGTNILWINGIGLLRILEVDGRYVVFLLNNSENLEKIVLVCDFSIKGSILQNL